MIKLMGERMNGKRINKRGSNNPEANFILASQLRTELAHSNKQGMRRELLVWWIRKGLLKLRG